MTKDDVLLLRTSSFFYQKNDYLYIIINVKPR